MRYRGAVLTTRISPIYCWSIIRGTTPAAGTCCQNAETNAEISLYSTIRHTPLSHCQLPAGHTTCIALYSMRINYMYNAPPISNKARKAMAPGPREKNKKKRRSMRLKENYIYIYFLFFSFLFFSFLFFSFLLAIFSHQGRKFRTWGEKISPGEKISHRPAFPLLGKRYTSARPGLRPLLGKCYIYTLRRAFPSLLDNCYIPRGKKREQKKEGGRIPRLPIC